MVTVRRRQSEGAGGGDGRRATLTGHETGSGFVAFSVLKRGGRDEASGQTLRQAGWKYSSWRSAGRRVCSGRMTGSLPSSIIAGISFIGRSGGVVKALRGFKKGHHTVPDTVNATTNAFLGKLCAGELAEEGETLFQHVRAGLGYKRKDVSLAVAGQSAVLAAKDFSVEIFYALEDGEASRYAVTTTLRELKSAELPRTAEFAGIFAGKFSEISFELKKGASVEAVIDAIEALDEEDASGLRVSYPSDCSECEIVVDGVEARVRCTGASLEMVFPRTGAPAELMDGFVAVRGAFAISKVLGGMIG